MGEAREKVAPWERYTDGEWHTVRVGSLGDGKDESLRQYRRHYESLRAWCGINRMRGQLSRSDYGRVLKVRIRPDVERSEADRVIGRLRGRSRQELGLGLVEAIRLLEYGLHLRQHGERAPGGNETWREFDTRAEAFLRRTLGADEEAK